MADTNTREWGLKTFTFNPVQENTYIFWDVASKEAAIIDAGMWTEAENSKVENFLHAEGLQLKLALQTHMHFDHIFGLKFIHDRYGIGPMCHTEEMGTYQAQPSMAMQFGLDLPSPQPRIARALNDGSTIQLGQLELKVIHTPGHTPGGCCYYCKRAALLFSGDTLFQGSVGRTDFPGGSMAVELSSIKDKLLILPDETVAYPGHGSSTTIGWEKQNNYYLF